VDSVTVMLGISEQAILNRFAAVAERWIAVEEARHQITKESTEEALKNMRLQNELIAKQNEMMSLQIGEANVVGLDKKAH
jgi:hypothetical protein